jgi:hypothetical protein
MRSIMSTTTSTSSKENELQWMGHSDMLGSVYPSFCTACSAVGSNTRWFVWGFKGRHSQQIQGLGFGSEPLKCGPAELSLVIKPAKFLQYLQRISSLVAAFHYKIESFDFDPRINITYDQCTTCLSPALIFLFSEYSTTSLERLNPEMLLHTCNATSTDLNSRTATEEIHHLPALRNDELKTRFT